MVVTIVGTIVKQMENFSFIRVLLITRIVEL